MVTLLTRVLRYDYPSVSEAAFEKWVNIVFFNIILKQNVFNDIWYTVNMYISFMDMQPYDNSGNRLF